MNEFNLKDEEIMGCESSFVKKHNNIYISDDQINILKNYNIYVENYKNVNELIYDIEECLNNSYGDMEDLEWVSQSLSEYNYYNNTNK